MSQESKASKVASEDLKKVVDEIVKQPSNGNGMPPPRKRMSPLRVNLIIGSIAAWFSIISISPFMIIYLLNEPPPAVYTMRKVLTPEVRPGETLRIRIAADVPSKCSAVVYRVVVDASTRRHGFDPVPRPQEPEYIIELPTPIEAVPGPAYYSGRLEWSCNFLQKLFPQSVTQKNIPFVILPSEKTLPELQQELAPPQIRIPLRPVPPGEEPNQQADPTRGSYQDGALVPYQFPTETVDPGYTAAQQLPLTEE